MKHPDGHADTKPLGLFVSSYLHQWLFQSKKTFSDLPSQRVNFILQQMAKVCRELLQLSHCFHPNLDLIYYKQFRSNVFKRHNVLPSSCWMLFSKNFTTIYETMHAFTLIFKINWRFILLLVILQALTNSPTGEWTYCMSALSKCICIIQYCAKGTRKEML